MTLDDLASRAASLADDLQDAIIQHLRDRLQDKDGGGTASKPDETERRLTRAHRSIVKASQLLRGH